MKTLRLFAFIIVLFLMLFDLKSVSAIDFPTGGVFSFPSIKPFPFPSKTPKPSKTPEPTTNPSSTPTPTPSPTPVSTKFEITNVDPSAANFMEEFTIFGSNFGTNPGSVSFRAYNQSFSSGGAPIVSWTNSEIKAKVPALRKGSYRIMVIRADGQKSNEERFSVKNGQPIVNSNSIKVENGEYEMTFQGTEFGKRGSIDIYNGSDLAAQGIIRSWSTSRIRFELPSLPRHEYGFQITTADGRKSSLRFFTVGN